MSGLEGFSDWTLSLLPRLFLYPGGVWLLAAVVGLRLASGGLAGIKPSALLLDLRKASLLAVAVAWAGLSLLPLPGAAPLSAPVDRSVLIAVVITSLALDEVKRGVSGWREGWVSVGMALAVLGPIARNRTLLGYVPAWDVAAVLSMLCVAVGIIPLSGDVVRHLSGAVRWLAWLGMGFGPVLAGWAQLPVGGVYWASLVYGVFIVTITGLRRYVAGYVIGREASIVGTVWVLAVLSLLAALLGY